MYQAKVNILLFRPTNLIMTLRRLRNRFKRSKESTINKRKDNRLHQKTKKFYNKFD